MRGLRLCRAPVSTSAPAATDAARGAPPRRYLYDNQLATLPERIFDGLGSLTELCVLRAAFRVAGGEGGEGARRGRGAERPFSTSAPFLRSPFQQMMRSKPQNVECCPKSHHVEPCAAHSPGCCPVAY